MPVCARTGNFNSLNKINKNITNNIKKIPLKYSYNFVDSATGYKFSGEINSSVKDIINRIRDVMNTIKNARAGIKKAIFGNKKISCLLTVNALPHREILRVFVNDTDIDKNEKKKNYYIFISFIKLSHEK